MATVAGLQGVIAVGDTIEECRVLPDWSHRRLGGIGIAPGSSYPPIDGIDINVSVEPVPIVE